MPIGWVFVAGNGGPWDRTTSVDIGLGAVKMTADDWLGKGNAMVTITKVGGASIVGGNSWAEGNSSRGVFGGWKAAGGRLESAIIWILSRSREDFQVS